MGTVDGSPLDRLRRPEYTGENRCFPCTAVNLVVAAALSALIGIASPIGGVAVAGLSLAAIYLRGYLVPDTPTLTERYLPDRVLDWFDEPPEAEIDADLDPESQLLAVGAVEPRGDDLRITDEFRRAWEASVEDVRGNLAERAAAILDIEDPGVEERANAAVVTDGGTEVARWPSAAALLADVAAIPLLRRRTTDWTELSRAEQGQLLAGLRIFVEECPDCGGDLAFSEERVESCCRTREVVTYDCADCGARITEVRQ